MTRKPRGSFIERTERIPSGLTVRYGKPGEERIDHAENLSETGLYIRTNEVFKVGTQLRLEVEFPWGDFSQRGEVMWAIRVPEHMRDSMVCGMGIRFVEPRPGWIETLRKWKRSLLQATES